MNKTIQKRTKNTIPSVNPQTGLTPLQEQCAALLVSGEKVSAVAEKLQVSRTTIYQWGDLMTFQCYINQLHDEIIRYTNESLLGMTAEAVNVIRKSLTSENENVRLKSATWLIGKISSIGVGQCNPFRILKDKATYEDDIFEMSKVFHGEYYNNLLSENKLKEDD
jgi:transposase-like protein